jgi:acyl-CoA synthetase (AMP-forming)/AMP-acid ligase II
LIFSIDQHGDRAALYDPSRNDWWSRSALSTAVAPLAQSLAAIPKSLIFNFCRNDLRSVAVYLAAMEADQPVALLDDNLGEELKQHLIHLYRPELVSASAAPSVAVAEFARGLWRTAEPFNGGLHADLSLMLSTSGSTGSPKFVRLTRRNVEANAASIAQALAIRPEDRAIASLPIHYSYGLSVLNTHLLTGASMVLTDDGLTAPTFWQAIRDHACTSFAGVPYSYSILNRLGLDALHVPSLHTLTQAGGKLNNDLIAKFSAQMNDRGGRFFVMYGQTEATARIAILPSGSLPARLGSAGAAIPGGRISIESEEVAGMPVGDVGELVYRGPNVMMGYATSRADLELGDVLGGVLRTGDMASLDREGFVYMTGRAKRDAKLFGLRINLDEVEDMLRKHGATAVIGRDEKLRIFCEYGDDTCFEHYRKELAARLQINYRAFEFVRIEKLPTKGSGKIDYQSLLEHP